MQGAFLVTGTHHGEPAAHTADLVLVVVGVRPNTELLTAAGASTGAGGAVVVDERMRTGLPNVRAAGDGAEISKRVDTYAAALHHGMTVAEMSDLDLSYTPPLGSPWDAVQMATQAWEHEARALTPTR